MRVCSLSIAACFTPLSGLWALSRSRDRCMLLTLSPSTHLHCVPPSLACAQGLPSRTHGLRGTQDLSRAPLWRPFFPAAPLLLVSLATSSVGGALCAVLSACHVAGKDGNVDQYHGRETELLPVSAPA